MECESDVHVDTPSAPPPQSLFEGEQERGLDLELALGNRQADASLAPLKRQEDASRVDGGHPRGCGGIEGIYREPLAHASVFEPATAVFPIRVPFNADCASNRDQDGSPSR